MNNNSMVIRITPPVNPKDTVSNFIGYKISLICDIEADYNNDGDEFIIIGVDNNGKVITEPKTNMFEMTVNGNFSYNTVGGKISKRKKTINQPFYSKFGQHYGSKRK